MNGDTKRYVNDFLFKVFAFFEYIYMDMLMLFGSKKIFKILSPKHTFNAFQHNLQRCCQKNSENSLKINIIYFIVSTILRQIVEISLILL